MKKSGFGIPIPKKPPLPQKKPENELENNQNKIISDSPPLDNKLDEIDNNIVDIDNENDSNIDSEEENDTITDLNKIPLPSDLISPSSKLNEAFAKKYEPIDWHTAFQTTYNLETKINDIDINIPIYISGNNGPNLVCLHGAGHSGLSFAPLALANKEYRIISFDFPSHGYNTTKGINLSSESLINQTILVLNYVNQTYNLDNIIVIGHSMGGAIATKTCEKILSNEKEYKDLYDKIMGLIVIDVVEGTAMDALPFMESIVNNRPRKFKTLEKGIEYMYKNGTIKNINSARISVPPLLELKDNFYYWKTNLMDSEKYWVEWFTGLTKSFLSCKIPKTLMLAGIERMDKELTIAQMQGKYKLSILRDVGHIIHEDEPEKVMKIIDDFIKTFRITPQLSQMKPVVGKLGDQHPETPVLIKYDKYK